MRRLTLWLWFAVVIGGVFPVPAGAADMATRVTANPDAVEAGFRLHGSHGYTILVVAYSAGDGNPGVIDFIVTRRGESASYRAPASVTGEAVRARLGDIAEVDVVRRSLGRDKTAHPRCFGGKETYEAAVYEGVIAFNGEEGYTRARKSRVAQLPAWALFAGRGPCSSGYGESIGMGEPGARLRGISYAHGRNLSFQVNKNRPKAGVVFTASLVERRGGIRIDRRVGGVTAPSAFRFDPQLRTATLSPPVPFSGSASLTRSRNSASPLWIGDLTLDFPGHSAVALAGPLVHVSLQHARFTRSGTANVEIGS